ncbi:hypothetical protein Pelo_17554 [Pelomyxa schiedti]|nr:hypothetical protein Pelo_17554 [Pelomyxa schiedti]
MEGRGTKKDEDYVYTGNFQDNMYAGKGKLIYNSRVIYDGEWADGEITGQGSMTEPNRGVFKGYFFKGKREGPGVWTYNNTLGNYMNYINFTCNYEGGQRQGLGKFTLKGGHELMCHWVRGFPDPSRPNAVLREDDVITYCPWKLGINEFPMFNGKGVSITVSTGQALTESQMSRELNKRQVTLQAQLLRRSCNRSGLNYRYASVDLSSNNVLMDIDGTPKICDFGVSHGMNTQQPQSIVPGTSVHMAPQMFTDHYSIEGDVWGFAILLTEIFNGEIVDSIFDTLPLDLHATFVSEQKVMLSQSDAEEVDILCLRQSMQVTIAHCLSRRLESLKKVKHLLTSPQSPLLSAGPIPNAVAKLLFMILRSCFSILEKNRISFTVISKLLFCCCTEATVSDISKNATINTLPPHQQRPTMVTDDQVTDSITHWLSALTPFIRYASQRL